LVGKGLNSTGAFGGGQLGYNWQTSNFVLGLDVDLGGVGNESRRGFGLTALDSTGTYITKTGAIAIKTEGGWRLNAAFQKERCLRAPFFDSNAARVDGSFEARKLALWGNQGDPRRMSVLPSPQYL